MQSSGNANNLKPPKLKMKKYQPPKPVKSEHQEFMKKIGIKLLELRNNKNISLSELSREVGISRNAYSQMEKGTVYFSLSNLMTVLDYYDFSAQNFFKDL